MTTAMHGDLTPELAVADRLDARVMSPHMPQSSSVETGKRLVVIAGGALPFRAQSVSILMIASHRL